MTPEADVGVRRPSLETISGPFPVALTIDVEEWYHTCLVPEYIDPEQRPCGLVRELDHLIPQVLADLEAARCRATFFVLGEVARQVPDRIREIVAGGHEVASHGYHHFRVGGWSRERFLSDVRRSKGELEDLLGEGVQGYRSPEWSLRRLDHPLLPLLVEAGFEYDSSLMPSLGSGRRDNPRWPVTLRWLDGASLIELPPLTYGGRLQLPASGWTARLAPVEWIASAVRRWQDRGGLPVLVAHPWELSEGTTPGELTGFARFVHEAGRPGYRTKFSRLLALAPTTSLGAALARGSGSPTESTPEGRKRADMESEPSQMAEVAQERG